jgi:hypothetical protein
MQMNALTLDSTSLKNTLRCDAHYAKVGSVGTWFQTTSGANPCVRHGRPGRRPQPRRQESTRPDPARTRAPPPVRADLAAERRLRRRAALARRRPDHPHPPQRIQDVDPKYADADLYAFDVINEYRTHALGELASDDDRPELLLQREDESSEDFQAQLNRARRPRLGSRVARRRRVRGSRPDDRRPRHVRDPGVLRPDAGAAAGVAGAALPGHARLRRPGARPLRPGAEPRGGDAGRPGRPDLLATLVAVQPDRAARRRPREVLPLGMHRHPDPAGRGEGPVRPARRRAEGGRGHRVDPRDGGADTVERVAVRVRDRRVTPHTATRSRVAVHVLRAADRQASAGPHPRFRRQSDEAGVGRREAAVLRTRRDVPLRADVHALVARDRPLLVTLARVERCRTFSGR